MSSKTTARPGLTAPELACLACKHGPGDHVEDHTGCRATNGYGECGCPFYQPASTEQASQVVTDVLRGPWLAVLADEDGTVYPTWAEAAKVLPDGAEMTIRVVRDSALPVDDEDGEGMHLTGSYFEGDLIFEIDAWLVDPDDAELGAEARYEQAKAMADGLTAAGRYILPAEPTLQQRLADKLHRIADDIVRLDLPLGRLMSARLSPGLLDSRVDLDRWATYLGTTVNVDPSNGIPHAEHKIRFDDTTYGPWLSVMAQTHPETDAEKAALRAELEALRAQVAAGGAQ